MTCSVDLSKVNALHELLKFVLLDTVNISIFDIKHTVCDVFWEACAENLNYKFNAWWSVLTFCFKMDLLFFQLQILVFVKLIFQ